MPAPVPTVLVLDPAGIVAAAVEEALALLPDRPELLVSRTGSIPETLISSNRPVAIVAAPSWTATAAKLRRLGTLARQLPTASLLLAIVDRPAASLRELIQTGADDLLPPMSVDELAAALGRGLRIAQRRANRPVRIGRLTTVASPTGGAGKTFLATNLASFVAKVTGERVVLVDLDLQFGEVSTALRLRPEMSIADAVPAIRDAECEADGVAQLSEILLAHEGGFSVLAAPADPVEADSITPADVEVVLNALRRVADHVIVDTPAGLPPHVLAALRLSDSVIAVGTPGRPSLHNLDQFLRAVSVVTSSRTEVSCVLNQQPEESSPDLSDFAGRFPQGFVAVLPHDREASRSINFGVPLVLAAGGSPLTRALTGALPKLLAGGDRTPVLQAPAGFAPVVVDVPVPDDEWDDVDFGFPAPVSESLGEDPELDVPDVAATAAGPAPRPCVAASSPRRRHACAHRAILPARRHGVASGPHPSHPDWPSGRAGTAGPQRRPIRLRGPPGPDPPFELCIHIQAGPGRAGLLVLRRARQALPERIHLAGQVGLVSAVVEDDVGHSPALGVGRLSGHPPPGVGRIQPPSGQPLEPRVLGGFHDDDQLVSASRRLHEQGDVGDDDRPGRHLGDPAGGLLGYQGMHDPVERGQRLTVAEDLGGEGRPVEGTVGPDHVRTEAFDDRVEAGPARLDDLTGDGVGVDHHRASGRQQTGHGGLPGPDTPAQSD